MSLLRIALVTMLSVMVFAATAQSDSLHEVLKKLGATPTDSIRNPQLGNTEGNVTIMADSSIVNLEKGTRGFRETKGYRIQVFLGSVDQAKSERNKFLSLGLPYSAYMKQVVPEYALQVGDFTTRMEMEKNLEIIRKHYPKAFAVVDVIEPPKFNAGKK